MKYNQLGKAGIKISELSFGSWVTFGNSLDLSAIKACMRTAFEHGVNFFDNAEVYAGGEAEVLMGRALREYRREDIVVSTKLFWGGKGPNDVGLSWKHLMEGIKGSLKRLQLEYVDLLFCHRHDPATPVEETVRAMDCIVRSGYAFYWGTSEWPRERIEEAFEIAEKYRCIPPTMEQPQYNMLVRERFEIEYAPLFEKYRLGSTIWSPLASGVLSGKYNDGVSSVRVGDRAQFIARYLTDENLKRLKQLKLFAKELNCTMAQLAIAWCLKNPHVSTVLTGATSPGQVKENMQAASVAERLSGEVMEQIQGILSS